MNNLPTLNGNWVDLVILIILGFFLVEGYRLGFVVMGVDFLSFLISLLLALIGYSYAAEILEVNFALSSSLSNAVGFIMVAVLSEALLSFIFIMIIKKLPVRFKEGKLNKTLGMLPAAGEGLVIIAFVITLVLAVPLNPSVKTDITESRIGGYITRKTQGAEKLLSDAFGGVIEDTLTYLTIKPDSNESIPLDINVGELTIDPEAEQEMFRLVNQERAKAGVEHLAWREDVVPVARRHARDMWERKYFSHISPDGKDVGDRLDEGGASYFFAGENLALAPTVQVAHTGLMNSEGHRRNILEPNFNQIGIGVIDNGVYGKMFVQVFTD